MEYDLNELDLSEPEFTVFTDVQKYYKDAIKITYNAERHFLVAYFTWATWKDRLRDNRFLQSYTSANRKKIQVVNILDVYS